MIGVARALGVVDDEVEGGTFNTRNGLWRLLGPWSDDAEGPGAVCTWPREGSRRTPPAPFEFSGAENQSIRSWEGADEDIALFRTTRWQWAALVPVTVALVTALADKMSEMKSKCAACRERIENERRDPLCIYIL